MKRIFLFILVFLCLTGCAASSQAVEKHTYTQIDQETAKEMMAVDGTQIIVDQAAPA